MPFNLKKLPKEITIACPICNHKYTPDSIRTIEETGDAILAHSKCPHCAGAVLSLLYKDTLGTTLVGLITDLDYQDVIKFKDGDYIKSDDVLRLYELLK